MKKLKDICGAIRWKVLIIFVSLFVGSSLVLAQGGPLVPSSSGIENPIAADSFPKLLELILNVVIEIGTPIVIISIIFVGFKFVTAQGNEGKLKEAKEAFFYVIIGAAIIIGCKVIVEIIQATVDSLK